MICDWGINEFVQAGIGGMKKNWAIRVIQGPQAGASCALWADRMVLGAADDCDVIIRSSEPDSTRFVLECIGDQFSLFRIGDDLNADASQVDIIPFVPFYIGDIQLVIGYGDGEWQIPVFSMQKTLENEINETGNALSFFSEFDAADGKVSPAAVSYRRSVPVWICALGGGVTGVALLIGAYNHFTSKDVAAALSLNENAPIDVIQSRINSLGLEKRLTVKQTGENKFQIRGTVQSDDLLARLPGEVSLPGILTGFNINSDEQIARSASEIIALYGANLAAKVSGEGVIQLSGFVAAADELSDIAEDIKSSIGGVESVDTSRTIVGTDIVKTVLSEAKEAGLDKSVFVSGGDKGQVFVTGTPGSDESNRWKAVQDDIEARAGKNVVFHVTFSPPRSEIPFSIKSIILGPIPTVITVGGRRVVEGGMLAPGYRLVAINRNSITVRWKNNEFPQQMEPQ